MRIGGRLERTRGVGTGFGIHCLCTAERLRHDIHGVTELCDRPVREAVDRDSMGMEDLQRVLTYQALSPLKNTPPTYPTMMSSE